MRMSACCNKCYDAVEAKVGSGFAAYGRFVARHPWKVILIMVTVNALLSIGMIRLNVVIDVERVYTPIGSQAGKDAERVKELFPDRSGSNFIGYQVPNLGRYGEVIAIPKAGNILNSEFLSHLQRFYSFLLSINTTDKNGQIVTLDDICARSYGNCAIDGNLFVDNQFIADVNSSASIPYPGYTHPTRGYIYYEQLVGNASASGGSLWSASMLLLRVNLRTDSEYHRNTAENWQNSFLEKIKEFSSDGFEIAYAHSDSLSEELNENVSADISIFVWTFVVIITYACLATMTARCDVVGQKSNLGFAGALAAGLAIVAAFGLGSLCGVEFVSIVGVIPFLIIGIGVDDMFMLMSGITSTNYESDVETRIGEMMRTSGVSITITSLTDLLAFAAGASSVFLSVRNFCIYCAIAVLFCYINQASFFIACIAINERRSEDNRHYFTCMKVKEPDEKLDADKGTCYRLCRTGRKPTSQRESESYLDKLPRWLIPKLVKPKLAKVAILVIFAGYLGVSVWGVTNLEEGLELKNLVSESSYYYNYRQKLDTAFPQGTPVSLVFQDTLTYSDSSVQTQIGALVTKVKAESTVKNNVEINWLSTYKSDVLNYNNTSEQNFIVCLRVFLSIASNKRFENDVVISDDNTTIKASRIHVMSENIKHSQEQGKFMLRMREIADENGLNVFAFSPAFLFYEQYVAIRSQTVQTVGIAVAMVFFVTIIFMPHPLLLLYVTSTVIMISVGIFGFLEFLGLTLSAITMIHLIMSIGFSVDFAAHICHGYMTSNSRIKDERMESGIIRSGAPIFHGAISSLLGVILLANAKSYIFFSFFQVMSLVITFGVLHALFFLPVILSLFGPSASMPGSQVNICENSKDFNSGSQQKDRPNGLSNTACHIPRVSLTDSQTSVRSQIENGHAVFSLSPQGVELPPIHQ